MRSDIEAIAANFYGLRSSVKTAEKQLSARSIFDLGNQEFLSAQVDELDPAAAALRQCLAAAEGDRSVSSVARQRLHAMLDFVEQASTWYEQMASLPKSQLAALMKLGSGISRWLPGGRGRTSRS